jgi:hypothetical protein
MDITIPIFFIALASVYDLFNNRKIPRWIFGVFTMAAVLSLFPFALDELQKITVMIGLAMVGLTFLSAKEISFGKADSAAWGATMIAMPDINFLAKVFIVSCMAISIWFILKLMAGAKYEELIKNGVPYLPFMLFGVVCPLLTSYGWDKCLYIT